MARPAWAVIVSDGLTPRLAETAAPIGSPTLEPGKPLISAAIAEAACEAALICLGLGAP